MTGFIFLSNFIIDVVVAYDHKRVTVNGVVVDSSPIRGIQYLIFSFLVSANEAFSSTTQHIMLT